MKCLHCQGTLERGTAPFHIDRNEYHLILDKVPAWVCTQCGEVLFESEEVDRIQEVARILDGKAGQFAISR